MAAQPLVYVHGAGPQDPPEKLKSTLDGLVFGRDTATTRVAYYANIRWGPDGRKREGLAPDRSTRAARKAAIVAAAAPDLSPEAAARAVVLATSAGGGAAGMGAAPDAGPPPEAFELGEELYRSADRATAASGSRHPALALGPSFPDWGFRIVVGKFASDVIDYLYGDWAERMREPVRKVLREGPVPGANVAHSLGTIILYDILNEPAFAGFKDVRLITAGSPLGIGNVQVRLRDRKGRPNPVPKSLKSWANFADCWDPVAIDSTLTDEFQPVDFAVDYGVDNPAKNNHDLTGYLGVTIVRETILKAVAP
jgi:hypothetical protein